MSSSPHDAAPAWSPVRRVIFRAGFSFFALWLVESLLDTWPVLRTVRASFRDPVVGWLGHSLFRLSGDLHDPGPAWGAMQLLASVAMALAIAAVWSLRARRPEYHRLNGWFRIGLRYYLGVVMLVYGGFKVIPSQFPPLRLEQLAEPLGSLPPMGLLWAYMGYSPLYAIFTGLGESVGALLLFFRRTTTAGALILVAVLSNVALINFLYDVPVKALSTTLLFAACILAADDLARLLAVFVYNQPVPPADLDFDIGPRMRRLRAIARPLVIAAALLVPLSVSFVVHRRAAERSALYGFYEVESFMRAGVDVPPLATDGRRWRTVVFSSPTSMSVRMMTEGFHSVPVTIDTISHRVLPGTRGNAADSLGYDRTGDRLRLHGRFAGDSVDVVLHRIDEREAFRLAR